jgi:uncharacterized protein (DUF1697 family)
MIKMDALRALYEKIGFKQVKTYIQSGNVVFQTNKTNSKSLEKKIAESITGNFGFDVPVMVKEAEEIYEILKNNSFINKRKEDVSKLHVTFLSDKPAKAAADKLKEGNYGADEFIIADKNVYLFCPGGYGNTKLSNTFFENKLKLTATTRNWKTINELAGMAESITNIKK